MIPDTHQVGGAAPRFLDVGRRGAPPRPLGSTKVESDDPLGAGSCWPAAHGDSPIFTGVLSNRGEECKIEEKAK